jgi:hypothetical protein
MVNFEDVRGSMQVLAGKRLSKVLLFFSFMQKHNCLLNCMVYEILKNRSQAYFWFMALTKMHFVVFTCSLCTYEGEDDTLGACLP